MISESDAFHTAIFDALCACLDLSAEEGIKLIHEAYAEPENVPRPPRNRNVIYWTVLQDLSTDPVSVEYTSGNAAGGSHQDYIADLMRETPTAANVEAYLALVLDHARLAAYQAAANEILFACKTADDAQKIWDRLGRELMGQKKVRCLSLSEAVNRYLDRMNDDSPPETLPLGGKGSNYPSHAGIELAKQLNERQLETYIRVMMLGLRIPQEAVPVDSYCHPRPTLSTVAQTARALPRKLPRLPWQR
jgi:hypothetical protein